MGHVNGIQHGRGVIGVHIADESGLHFESIVYLRPVFQRKIHGAGAKVTAADADLHHGGEFLPCRVCDFTGMYLICQLSDFFLLLYVKAALVHAIGRNAFPKLSPGHMMEHHALLPGIDHFTIVKSFKLSRKLCLFRQFCKRFQHLVIHLLGGVIVSQPGRHGNRIFPDPFRPVLPCHCLPEIYGRHLPQLLVCRNGIQIVPGNHTCLRPP